MTSVDGRYPNQRADYYGPALNTVSASTYRNATGSAASADASSTVPPLVARAFGDYGNYDYPVDFGACDDSSRESRIATAF
jgi:hypothetical protein